MPHSTKYKVLMIDDEADIVSFFKQAFSNFQHIDFFTALRAKEGIEIARKEKPQIVMVDLRMPGMNGEEALKEMKTFLPKSKYIVMSGWDEGNTQKRLEEEMGVAAFFKKPVDKRQEPDKFSLLHGKKSHDTQKGVTYG